MGKKVDKGIHAESGRFLPRKREQQDWVDDNHIDSLSVFWRNAKGKLVSILKASKLKNSSRTSSQSESRRAVPRKQSKSAVRAVLSASCKLDASTGIALQKE